MSNELDRMYEDARAEARASGSGGDYLLYKASPGQWFAGVFVGYENRTAPFGEVTMGRFVRVKTDAGDFPAEAVKTFDIIDHVARLELLPPDQRPDGPAGKNPVPEPGSVVFVEYQGKRTSKSGTSYNGYLIRVTDPTDESRSLARAADSSTPRGPKQAGQADPGDDVPFIYSR